MLLLNPAKLKLESLNDFILQGQTLADIFRVLVNHCAMTNQILKF